MKDIVGVWRMFRDPLTGLWCDNLYFQAHPDDPPTNPCGPDNDHYSSAGTGMGLVSEAVMAELGYQTKEQAETRVIKTLTKVLSKWPRENFSGFLVHFTNRNFEALSEFSTIDTTLLVLGALFAGNYLGGEVESLARQVRDATKWSKAIVSETHPGVMAVVNKDTGDFAGDVRPFNEYYLVAYLANLTSKAGSKANKYFETFMSTTGEPVGDGAYPVHKSYGGYDLLTDQPHVHMSSFIPQFNYYLARGYQNNPYYSDLNTRWLKADKLFWSQALDENSKISGIPVLNKTWGAGAGPCPPPTWYCVDRIDSSPDLVISAPIMAGFLPNADTPELRQEINSQLEWMYENDVCTYPVSPYKILWRCSVKKPDWKSGNVDSIDFSTMILGYATNFLPDNFYNTYAA